MGKLDLLTVRPRAASDDAFIYSIWLRGLYYGNEWYREIPRFIYYKKYHPIVEAILAKKDVSVSIVCLKEDPDVIIGFSVTQKAILHWIYTKLAWRKFGIAKHLLEHGEIPIKEVTHLTIVGRSIKPKEWIFNPFLI